MRTGRIKIAVMSFIATLFGLVQICCACLPIQNLAVQTQSHMSMQASNMHMSHTGHDQQNTDHDTQHACQHDLVIAVSSDLAPPSLYLLPVNIPVTGQNLAGTYMSSGPISRTALKWFDPPNTLPIFPKTRLLI